MLRDQALEKFELYSQKLEHMRALGALIGWDDWMGLPEKGVAFRDGTRAYLENERLSLIKSEEYGQVLDTLSTLEASLDLEIKAMLREARREKKISACLPQERLVAYDALRANAQRIWQEAHHTSDYELFKPYLKQIIEFNQELSRALSAEGHMLDPLMDILDPGATVAITDEVFEDLKTGLKELLAYINNSQTKISNACLTFDFDEGEVSQFCQALVEELGYDPGAGGYAKTLHPFTSSLGPKDARITTNYKTFAGGLFALMHEAGHGMYAQGGMDSLDGTALWGGLNGAMHESQSRLYENIIGRSYGFWSYYYPKLQEAVTHFKTVPLMTFYQAINAVQPSLIRVHADEVTYSMHVILRYELEKQLLSGELHVDDLPKAWDDAYEAYLGVRPENDREGVLQDVHWSTGYFGYFQSYSLGNMYSAQIFEAMKADLPDIEDQLTKGEFKNCREWLKSQIHQYGGIYTPVDLIVKATGKPLQAKPYIDYLNKKYRGLYF